MARRDRKPGRSKPPTPRVSHYRTRYDPVDVYLSVLLVGATRAATLHTLSRRTVYRAIERVETDDVLLATANTRRTALAAEVDAGLAALRVAAMESLRTRIVEGKVTSRLLAELAQGNAPAGTGGGGGRGSHALEVPTILSQPRVEQSPPQVPDGDPDAAS